LSYGNLNREFMRNFWHVKVTFELKIHMLILWQFQSVRLIFVFVAFQNKLLRKVSNIVFFYLLSFTFNLWICFPKVCFLKLLFFVPHISKDQTKNSYVDDKKAEDNKDTHAKCNVTFFVNYIGTLLKDAIEIGSSFWSF